MINREKNLILYNIYSNYNIRYYDGSDVNYET